MIFLFFNFIFSISTEIIQPQQSIQITIEPNYVLVPVNPKDFIGQTENQKIFGDSSKYILNKTKETIIKITNPSETESKSFEYFLFPFNQCLATEIFINPENNLKFTISNVTNNDENIIQMVNLQKLCFYYVWSSDYQYSMDFQINHLEKTDTIKYTTDVGNIPNQQIDSSLIVQMANKNSLSIVFESDYIYTEGNVSFTIKTDNQIKETLHPDISNSVLFESTNWITLDQYKYILRSENIEEDEGLKLPWLHITGIVIAALIGCFILYLVLYLISTLIYSCCDCWLDPDEIFCCYCGSYDMCCGLC